MISAAANEEAAVVSVPVSTIEVEVLGALRVAIIRNPPTDLTQFGVRDGATWRQYGDENGYDFFDPILKGERALPVGEAQTWVFADADREIAIRGMLIADDVEAATVADFTLEDLVQASFRDAPNSPPPEYPKPFADSPIGPGSPPPAASGVDLKQTLQPSALPDTPIEQPAPIDFRQPMTYERAYADMLRMRRADEPGSALGPGAASVCGNNYDPFRDFGSLT